MDTLAAPSCAYTGPAAWRTPIAAALGRVVDPEIGISIVDLGLVHAIVATPQRWLVLLTMTSAACPMTELIVDDAEAELARIAPEGTVVTVDVVREPAWSPDRMSRRARELMGW